MISFAAFICIGVESPALQKSSCYFFQHLHHRGLGLSITLESFNLKCRCAADPCSVKTSLSSLCRVSVEWLEGKSQITPHMHSLIYVALFVFRRFVFKIKQIFFWESVAESEVHWDLGVSLKSPAGFQPVTHQMTDKRCSTCAMLPSNGDMLKKEKKKQGKSSPNEWILLQLWKIVGFIF